MRSQSLLIEVFFPTQTKKAPHCSHVVAIPSNWGLLSYNSFVAGLRHPLGSQSLLIEVFFPTANPSRIVMLIIGVAIPSNWGLLSYLQLKKRDAKQRSVAIPSNWGLLSYSCRVFNLPADERSQSLLIEVFFPTDGVQQKRLLPVCRNPF